MQQCTTLKCQSAAQRHLAATNATAYCQRHLAIEKKKANPKPQTEVRDSHLAAVEVNKTNQNRPTAGNMNENVFLLINAFAMISIFSKQQQKKNKPKGKTQIFVLGFLKFDGIIADGLDGQRRGHILVVGSPLAVTDTVAVRLTVRIKSIAIVIVSGEEGSRSG